MEEQIERILNLCKSKSFTPYLGSDGFHHRYGDESITLDDLEKILDEVLLNKKEDHL